MVLHTQLLLVPSDPWEIRRQNCVIHAPQLGSPRMKVAVWNGRTQNSLQSELRWG